MVALLEKESTKPVLVDPAWFAMLTQDRWDCPCEVCHQPQAKWALRESVNSDAGVPVCGLCFITSSPWAVENKVRVTALISDIEKESGVPFMRSGPGMDLVSCKDADQVMGSILVISKIYFRMKAANAQNS